MKSPFLALVLTFACVASQAATWVKAYDNGEQQIFIDMDTLQNIRGEQKVWLKWTFRKKQTRPHTEPFQSYIKLKHYNCATKGAVTKKVIAYERADWTGPIVYAAEYPHIKREEDDVMPSRLPADARASVLQVVCVKG